jgi:hypothetical protein
MKGQWIVSNWPCQTNSYLIHLSWDLKIWNLASSILVKRDLVLIRKERLEWKV